MPQNLLLQELMVKAVLVERGEFITEEIAQKIIDAGVESVTVRTYLPVMLKLVFV